MSTSTTILELDLNLIIYYVFSVSLITYRIQYVVRTYQWARFSTIFRNNIWLCLKSFLIFSNISLSNSMSVWWNSGGGILPNFFLKVLIDRTFKAEQQKKQHVQVVCWLQVVLMCHWVYSFATNLSPQRWR